MKTGKFTLIVLAMLGILIYTAGCDPAPQANNPQPPGKGTGDKPMSRTTDTSTQ